MIVLDTSALLFWTLDSDQLTPAAQRAIEETEQIMVSSISIWEIALKVKHGKLEIPLPIVDYVKKLHQLEKLEILPVDDQAWLDNLDQPWEHRDPADRTIMALAKRLDCPLISSNRVITEFYPQTIW